MVRVVVTGLGLRCGLGDLPSTWQRLLRGETAIHLRQPFGELPLLPLAMIGQNPVDLESVRRDLVADVLAHAQLQTPLRDCAVIVGSSRGFQGQWEQLQRTDRSPNFSQWLNYLPNQLAAATARQIGSQGATLAPMGACATGLWAISQGFELLQYGTCERVLVGAIESPVTRLSLTGFQRMGALASTGCLPFDRHREGLVLGEGGAMLMLETLEAAKQRGAKIYGEILGWSFTCDAHHISAPQSDHLPAMRAIAQCLQRSGLQPEEVDHIHPHGTSTQLNDQAEAYLIETLFPQRPWVSGSKGATGHSLGASGAISAALTVMMLDSQTLFPCVGLNESAFDLQFVRQSQAQTLQTGLCFSFGFGGQNGAIAISKF